MIYQGFISVHLCKSVDEILFLIRVFFRVNSWLKIL